MKLLKKTGLSVVLSALMLSGTVAFAQPSTPRNPESARKLEAAIATSATTQAIQSATFENREQVLADLEAHLRAAAAILSTQKLGEKDGKDVEQAVATVDASIRKARGAVAADWDQVRSEVNDSFAAYAAVAIRAEQSASDAGK